MDWESRIFFESPRLKIGQFRCGPASPLWREDNQIGQSPVVVFPRRAVEIHQSDRDLVIANPNHVIFYDAHQPYRRRVVDPRGDLCEFFAVSPRLLDEMLGRCGLPPSSGCQRLFSRSHGPCSSANYLAQRMLFSLVSADGNPDTMLVEESFFDILDRVLTDAGRFFGGRPQPAGRRDRADHRDRVKTAIEFIARHFLDPLSLDQIADAADCSVYHLCRVFKTSTGLTIHQYLSQFRLRSALEQLGENRRADLTRLAIEHGYSSHSHFTSSFRRSFGLSPDRVRRISPALLLRQIQAD